MRGDEVGLKLEPLVRLPLAGDIRAFKPGAAAKTRSCIIGGGDSRLGRARRPGLRSGTPDWDVTAIALDPKDSQIVYAGTREGVFKTADGGQHWMECDMGATGFAIAIDPVDTRIVYAGTREDAIYRSTDGGETSSQFNQGAVNSDVSGLGGGDVMALAIDSTTRTVYAGTTGNGVSDYQPKG